MMFGRLKSILSLLAMGTVMVESPLPKMLLSKVAKVLALVVFSCLLVSGAVMAVFVCLYQYLLSVDITPVAASLCILGGLVLVAAIFVSITIVNLTNFGDILHKHFKRPVPLTSHLADEAGSVLRSFLGGVSGRNQSPF